MVSSSSILPGSVVRGSLVRGLFVPGLFALGLVAAGPARADTLVSVRPGVACTSADALARLTRPDGSSRSTPANATADARETARRGGCFPFGPGMTVYPHSIRRQTSIVTAYAVGDTGPLTVYVANIDFERGAAPAGRGAGLPGFPPPVPPATVAVPQAGRPAAEVAAGAEVGAAATAEIAAGGTRRSLSSGLLSLEMTTRDAKRRLAGAFTVFDLAGSGTDPDAGFIAERRDQSERYEVHSRDGTVFLVMHAVRFAGGRQPVLSALVDRLLARYGTGPTLLTLPGAAAAAPSIPPQPGWQHDWTGHPVVMALRDSLEDATRNAGGLARCAQQMALLDPSDTGDTLPTDGRVGGPDPKAPSCGREVLVRLEPGTVPGVVGRLLVILADQPPGEGQLPGQPPSHPTGPDATLAGSSVR